MNMQLKDIFKLPRWEAQEAIGFLYFLENASKDPNHRADFEIFNVHSSLLSEALLRNNLYRLDALNFKNRKMCENHQKSYQQLIERTKSDQSIHIKNIPLSEAVKYKLHVSCLITQEDGLYGASFSNEPYLYIFPPQALLFSLILDGSLFPKIAQQFLGIRQSTPTVNKKKHYQRDIMAQTIAHIAFSLDNTKLRWNITTLAKHSLMKNFDLNSNLTGSRQLQNAIREIIPPAVRVKSNPHLRRFTDQELNMQPLIIPEVIFKEENEEIRIDFSALRIVLRTALLMYKLIKPKGALISREEFLKLPLLQQFTNILNENERLVFDFELHGYSQKFGALDCFWK